MVGWQLAALNAVVVPFAGEYRDFHRFKAPQRVNGSKKRRHTRSLRANSLRIRTGNFWRPCREFKLAIREISAVIRDPAFRPLFGGCAPIPLERNLEYCQQGKEGGPSARVTESDLQQARWARLCPAWNAGISSRARNRNARHPGASRAVSRVVAGAPDYTGAPTPGSNNQKAWSRMGGASDLLTEIRPALSGAFVSENPPNDS